MSHTRTKSTSVRVSSYRHIFGEAAKETNRYEELKNPLTTGDGSFCKANTKFFAVPKKGGGGPLYLLRHEDVGRLAPNVPLLSVHKGTCWDFDFHPFIENMIATASDDCKVAITKFPMEGLKEAITEPTVVLDGHSKKSTNCEFHPTANSILATGGFDRAVKIWNIETGANLFTYDQFEETLYSMGWNNDGSLLGTSSKDKKLRMFDPRQLSTVQSTVAFDGTQCSKIFWIPKFNWIAATGFSKTAKRQLKIYDIRKFSEPVLSNDVDQAAGVLLPHWDNDNGVLYLAGKGEGHINYYELESDEKILHTLGAYRSNVPQRGGGWLPKRSMDVRKCEVARFLKLAESSVIPISFIVPRKAGADVFQKDIFPDAYAGVPSLSAEEWVSGQNKDPILASMDPKNSKEQKSGATPVQFNKTVTHADLVGENEKLKNENQKLRARIQELEQKLGISPETTQELSVEEREREASTGDRQPEEPAPEEQPAEETQQEQQDPSDEKEE